MANFWPPLPALLLGPRVPSASCLQRHACPTSLYSLARPPARADVCAFLCFCCFFVFSYAGRAALPRARARGRGLDG